MFDRYHFDKWTVDKRGDYHDIVNIFPMDFSDEIDLMRKFDLNESLYNKQNYGHAANAASKDHAEEDKANPDGDPSANMFMRWKFTEDDVQFPKFIEVAKWFALDTSKKRTWKFHDQVPNNQLMIHIDNLPGIPSEERVMSDEFKHSDQIRFLVLLEDWEPGQIIQFGNCVETQWHRGTAFTWEWSTLPHATWNGSWRKRPALQITGTPTEETFAKIG